MPVRIIFQNDVRELRDVVEREIGDIDAALASCTHLDAATAASWLQAKAIDVAWIAQVDAGVAAILPQDWGALYSQGRGLEAVLRENWWPRLQSLGCTMPFAQPPAPREPGLSTDAPDISATLATLEGLAKALLLILVYREAKGLLG